MRGLKKLSLAMLIGLSGLGITYTNHKQIAIEDFKSRYDSVIDNLYDSSKYKEKNIPFDSETFKDSVGAIIYAPRDKGIEHLVFRSKTSKTEDIWAFIPENSLWVNLTLESTKMLSFHDVYLAQAAHSYRDIELYHTHLDEKILDKNLENDSIVLELLSEFGPAVSYVPSFVDTYTALFKKMHYETNITHGVVSTRGVMMMELDSVPSNPGLMFFLEVFKGNELLSVSMIKHFKGYSVSDLECRAKEYNGMVKLEFKEYSKK